MAGSNDKQPRLPKTCRSPAALPSPRPVQPHSPTPGPTHLVPEDELPGRLSRGEKSLTQTLGYLLDCHIRREREHPRLAAFQLSYIMAIPLGGSGRKYFTTHGMYG